MSEVNHAFTDVQSITEAERLGRLYPIVLENHNPAWEEQYERQRIFLCELFGDAVLRISHIGSTAVPGLVSKPTVDILLEIKDNTDLTGITERLQNDGYIVNRPPNDIIMYIKGYGEKGFEGQTFHVHVRECGDHNELYFRDYLKAHPEVAKEYGELKKSLKQKFEHDRDGYTAAKGDFITKTTAAARDEFGDKYK